MVDSAAVRRIAVVGAECTGKTQLCTELARELGGTTFVEPLRAFVSARGRAPNAQEQSEIVLLQKEAEHEAETRARERGLRWVFCDSAPIMTAVYSLTYFQDERLLEGALTHHAAYFATLLCADDLAWQADPGQRDGPAVRAQTQAMLLDRLRGFDGLMIHVRGEGADRERFAREGLLALD
ncbi:MAG: hypothetical protein EBT03_06305 [Betaproteobacteria bacterium]|nr:hypothetical protein [Betaproteobacteria bacterium]NBT74438.1 hypothetical protein [Betaproteobacteria bacterium]NBY13816.1 hypothetical protein [Betaproteobacteria bacterium]NCA16180.1 hypothetical protein [Betaproteobacteria bacterium]